MNENLNIYTSESESLTLLDLQRMVRATLESRFDRPLWLNAEISELKVNRSGHCYLNLVEKGEGSATPRAEARAVIWRSTYAAISAKFERATGAQLSAGISVMVNVMVTYHEVYGFSLQILDINTDYSLGEVERRRRQTIEQLKADGLWDMNHELELTPPTLRIAIVSSGTAAGYRDFVMEISRSSYRFELTLFESLMQGDAAEESILRAMYAIAEREDEFDIVAILRGGGSTSDLALFDSYAIASHVAGFPLPVFTGIGHDKDISVVDMVAHTACKTPTAVATTLVEMADNEMARIEYYAQALRDGVVARINGERITIEQVGSELSRNCVVMLSGLQHRLDTLEESITSEARHMVCSQHQRLDAIDDIVASHNPRNILSRGFAIVRDAEGRVIDIDTIELGASVNIEISGGELTANVQSKHINTI